MKRALVCFLALMTAACGWHLRGSIALPGGIERIHLSADDPYSPLLSELQQQLSAGGVELAASASDAPYTLTILEQRQESRVAGVGSDSLANAYEVTLETRYSVLRRVGDPVAEDLSSSVRRSYDTDAATAGSGAREEVLVLREMRRDLAQQILRRLQAEINNAEAEAPQPELD